MSSLFRRSEAAPDPSGDWAIEAVDVTKVYGPTRVEALKGVSLRVAQGELTAIVGPSGSGKSTLLNMIGALDRPTAGRVLINGQDTSLLSDARLSALRGSTIGFVFQRFHLSATLTALDNVSDGLLYSGVSRRTRRRDAAAMLERVGLGERLEHEPRELSGGEQQRVAIARAVLGNPPIVLADEPTGNLDTRSGDSVVQLLTELNAAGTTVVVITHDQELAERLPRRSVVRDGLVIADEFSPVRAGATG